MAIRIRAYWVLQPACWPCWRFSRSGSVRCFGCSSSPSILWGLSTYLFLDYYHAGRPPYEGWGVGCHLRDPDHLRTPAADHALRRILSTGASSSQGGASPHGRCSRVLKLDWMRYMVPGGLGDEAIGLLTVFLAVVCSQCRDVRNHPRSLPSRLNRASGEKRIKDDVWTRVLTWNVRQSSRQQRRPATDTIG